MNFMCFIKIILFIILIIVILIQFVQPSRNKNGEVMQTDFSTMYSIPDSVFTLFKNACYDCHSNNTNYPWYSNIQPIAGFLEKDIIEGKEKLNFSEFGSYSSRRRISKLRDIEYRIKDGKMPLKSYKFMHRNARLSDNENDFLIKWIDHLIDSISLKK